MTSGVLVIITKDKTINVYSNSDAYPHSPNGLGSELLKILRRHSKELDKISQNICNIQMVTKEEFDEKKYRLAGGRTAFENMRSDQKYNIEDDARFEFDFEYGGDGVLESIFKGENVTVEDYTRFLKNSVAIDWAYVIDMVAGTYEVYDGCNQEMLTPEDRFYYLQDDNEKYKPVKICASFKLDSLPSYSRFIKAVTGEDADESDRIKVEKYLDDRKVEERDFMDEEDAWRWTQETVSEFFKSGDGKLEIYNDSHMIAFMERL